MQQTTRCWRQPRGLRVPVLALPRRANTKCWCSASPATAVPINKDVIQKLDAMLASGDEKGALEVMEQLKTAGSLRGFGGAQQVPKRQYTLEELRLNRIDATTLLSPKDQSLNTVRNYAQGAAVAGLCAYAVYLGWDGAGQVLAAVFAIIFTLGVDQVANNGGGEALAVDSLGRIMVRNYARRVALHEAGHFLVAYLMGLLPRAYTLSAWDAFTRYRTLNLQAGTQFCDAFFQRQVAAGQLSSSSLDIYVCVALAGVVTEALCYGQAEGGLGDVAQLDGLLRALNFTQKKADGEIRWAVLNAATLLRRHADVHAKLADAMQRNSSVASCIALIEEELKGQQDI